MPCRVQACGSVCLVICKSSGSAMRQSAVSLARLYLCLWLLPSHTAHSLAQSSASYDIPWQSVDGGAGRNISASYVLISSIGQPDASRAWSASYELSGGFQRTSGNPPDNLFGNGFE